MELTGYASIARRWWRRILAATMAGAIVGLLAVPLIPPTYEATARLLIGPVNADLDTQRSAGSLARTYADLLTSRTVLDPVARQFNLDVDDVADQTKTTASEATRIVTIVVQNERSTVAANVANAMVAKLIEFASRGSTPEGAITVVDAAEPPPDPSAPSIPLVIALTTATGFVTAMLILILVESFSRIVRDEDDVARAVDLPVVAALRPGDESRNVPRRADLAMVTAHLVASARTRPHVRLAISGTGPGRASARVAARASAELAAFGGRVSVIDLDGRVSGLLRNWGDPQHGRTTARAPGAAVETIRMENGVVRVVRPTDGAEMREPVARPPEQHVAGGLGRDTGPATAIDGLLAAAEENEGITLIHVDYATASVSALRWVEVAGEALVVVGLDESRREDLYRIVEVLKVLGVPMVGIVVVERRKLLARFERFRPSRGRRRSSRVPRPSAATHPD